MKPKGHIASLSDREKLIILSEWLQKREWSRHLYQTYNCLNGNINIGYMATSPIKF